MSRLNFSQKSKEKIKKFFIKNKTYFKAHIILKVRHGRQKQFFFTGQF